jgi:hypothetical protein
MVFCFSEWYPRDVPLFPCGAAEFPPQHDHPSVYLARAQLLSCSSVRVIREFAVQSFSAGRRGSKPHDKECEARKLPNGRNLSKDQEAAVGQRYLVPIRPRIRLRPA